MTWRLSFEGDRLVLKDEVEGARVTVEYAALAGEQVLVGLYIESDRDIHGDLMPRALTKDHLRKQAQKLLQERQESRWFKIYAPQLTPPAFRIPLKEPRHPGRRGHTDIFLAAVASQYVRRVAAGSKSPVRDVAEATERSLVGVRKLLEQARDRGLLTATTPGKASGVLTDKALELLRRKPARKGRK